MRYGLQRYPPGEPRWRIGRSLPKDDGEKQSNSGWILEVKSAWSARDWVWGVPMRGDGRGAMKVTPLDFGLSN